ncbi:MAG: hypothetical protein QQN41_06110 [Nitrosopumilus sp.]
MSRFFIVNKSKQQIIIGDINVSLGPHQAIDLDKIMPRTKSDNSKDLKIAAKRGIIKIKQKTDLTEKKTEIVKHEYSASIDNAQIEDMKQQIRAEVREELKKQFGDFQLQQPQTVDSGEILASIEDLKGILSSGSIVNASQQTDDRKRNQIDDISISEETLIEMHERVANKIVEGVESKVEHIEKKVIDNVDERANELEDLLG